MAADVAALRRHVEAAMRSAGLDAVGVTSADPFTTARVDLEQRRDAGQHGGMAFTFRNPRRSTEPSRLLRNAASLVVGALGYPEPETPAPDSDAARVSRYAQRDYYRALRTGLEAGAQVLREAGYRTNVVADSNGLVDRAAAYRAGIGWWGRNSNLLIPGIGSWFVLGSVVTDAELPANDEVVPDGCRTCTRCIDACPTGAIVGDGVIDARRCLAWLLQATGVFPRAFRAALGNRIYGCDDCQDVCPPGRRRVDPTPVEISSTRHSAGNRDEWLRVTDLLEMSDDELMERFGRWYIPQRDPRYIRRNALVVLGNVGDATDEHHRRLVSDYLAHPDGLLRAHAVWAAARLGLDLPVGMEDDPDPRVRAEMVMVASVPPAPASIATRAGARS